jgi:basic membrane protein A and related proteins
MTGFIWLAMKRKRVKLAANLSIITNRFVPMLTIQVAYERLSDAGSRTDLGGAIVRHSALLKSAILFVTLLVCSQCPAADAVSNFKVAYLPCGRVNDQSWSQAGYDGVMAVKNALRIQVAYSESVSPADIESAARDYASKGYDFVMLHCATFTDAGLKVAKDFPKTWFEVNSAPAVPPNVLSLNMQSQEGAFLGGIVAGLTTKTNRIGALANFNTLGLNRQIEGFRLGARFVNPKVEVFVTYLNNAEDAAKAKEAALAQIDAGADVLLAAADQAATGIFRAADERHVFAVAAFANQNKMAPKVVLGSLLYNLSGVIQKMVESTAEGNAEGGLVKPGVKDGVGTFAANDALMATVPAEANSCLLLVQKSFAAGAMQIPDDKIMGRQDGAKTIDTKSVVSGGIHPCLNKRT